VIAHRCAACGSCYSRAKPVRKLYAGRPPPTTGGHQHAVGCPGACQRPAGRSGCLRRPSRTGRISIAREPIGNGGQVLLLESGGRDVERRTQRLNRGQSVGYPIHRLHHDPGRRAERERTPPPPLRPVVVETNILVDRAELQREDGSRSSVRARLVVLTAGGIENPRLPLLNRRIHRHGLGNGPDLVGRFFAGRMSARTGHIVPASPELIGRAGLYPVHEQEPGVLVQGALRVRDAVQRERQLLDCAFFPPARNRRRRPLPQATAGHLRNVANGRGDRSVDADCRVHIEKRLAE
jgi:hypothetical protein